jgi:ADP-ribosylglycohydrolase
VSASKKAIVNSALWAAYGDALGFITELADLRTLKYRAHTDKVLETVAWRRSIGGRFGASIELPAGCYSDDTQLRLATSRCIRGDGYFDVEAFAKVELPVWLSYSLGAGTSTKSAASNLARVDVNWFSDFFEAKGTSYLNAGGNGAVMRIQPHVWASSSRSDDQCFRDVFRNAISTHGHPRAIAGAYFHAICLRSALSEGTVPDPDAWHRTAESFSRISKIISGDNDLRSIWLPVWEERLNTSIDQALRIVTRECVRDIESLHPFLGANPESSYKEMIEAIGANKPDTRGSGTKTAILGCALAWMCRHEPPLHALTIASNLLGSDTDTIATVAGAILGAVSDAPPKGALQDREYIEDEASRLHAISKGERASSFNYPDLMQWRPPRTMLDSVGVSGDRVVVAGLGEAKPFGDKLESRKKDGTCWQWLRFPFGQTILGKQRRELPQVSSANLNFSSGVRDKKGELTKMQTQPELFRVNSYKETQREPQRPSQSRSIDDMTTEAIKSGFNYDLIGRHLVDIAEGPNGIELAIAYTAIIAKAKRARLQAAKRE